MFENKNYIHEIKLSMLHFDVICCLKQIPYHLILPSEWRNMKQVDINQIIKKNNLSKDIKGNWIWANFSIYTGGYWAEQEEHFCAGMKLMDSCVNDSEEKNGNCLFYKLEDHIEVMCKKRGPESRVIEYDNE